MGITWPETIVNDTIKEIRNAIGREIIVNIKTVGTPCPTCDLDPVTNTSTDSGCPTCSGLYWIDYTDQYLVSGHVRWFSSELPFMKPGGFIPDGDCLVTIEATDANLSAVENSSDFVVDGKRTTLKYYRLKGVPRPNRIAITMVEEGKNNG